MSKILIGIIVAMGLSGILYYQFSVVPMKNKIEEQGKVILAQDLRNQEQIATIEAIQTRMEQTTIALTDMQNENQRIEAEMSEYLDIFRRHNTTKLASAKPGLMEKRINNATKGVFDAIENDSKRISSLND